MPADPDNFLPSQIKRSISGKIASIAEDGTDLDNYSHRHST